MESIFSIVIFVILSSILIIILRGYNSGIAFMLSIAAVVIILLLLLPTLIGLIDSLQSVSNLVSHGYFDVIIKAVGISVLTQLTSELCIDAGQRSMSGIVQLSGKVAIITSALPLLGELLEQIMTILG